MTDVIPPEGWFTDPNDPDKLRWWDGQHWTDRTAPIPETAPPPPTETTRFQATSSTPGTLGHVTPPPNETEAVGRAVGERKGYTVRSFISTTTEPAVQNRPNIPTWQKVVGVVAWPLMLLTPHGWLFLAASFFMMVVMGHHTVYSWAAWVTKWASVFILVSVVLIAVVIIILVAAHSNNASTALIQPLRLVGGLRA